MSRSSTAFGARWKPRRIIGFPMNSSTTFSTNTSPTTKCIASSKPPFCGDATRSSSITTLRRSVSFWPSPTSPHDDQTAAARAVVRCRSPPLAGNRPRDLRSDLRRLLRHDLARPLLVGRGGARGRHFALAVGASGLRFLLARPALRSVSDEPDLRRGLRLYRGYAAAGGTGHDRNPRHPPVDPRAQLPARRHAGDDLAVSRASARSRTRLHPAHLYGPGL